MNFISAKKYPNLRVFFQYGFDPQGEAGGSNVFGRCPFCSKDKHFYINTESKAWDCKRCGEKGGFQTFLDKMFDLSRTEPRLDSLANDRGLSQDTLDHFYIGHLPWLDAYLIPIWDMNRDKIHDLRIFADGKILSTSGCHVGLFNWWDLFEPFETIYICEGEWDGMALYEVLKHLNLYPSSMVVAVPGAGTFKAEWMGNFQGKKVRVLYDNDKAGQDGAVKVYKQLKTIAKELKFIHWDKTFPEGFDVRDLYVKKEKGNAAKTLKYIQEHLHDAPPGTSDGSLPAVVTQVQSVQLLGPGVTPEEVYTGYRKWLHLPDKYVLDFMFGTVIANRLPGDPLWGQIVGPSGATKTELLQSLTDAPFITTATSLTPHSLISGANFAGAGDPSLIPKWNGKVVIIKDLTVLMNMNVIAREEIFGILRDAYDGKTEKNFGNGVHRVYECRFGMIAGVTPIIEIYAEEHTALGERFLRYPVIVPATLKEKMDLTRRAVGNTLHEVDMRAELRVIAKAVLDFSFDEEPEIPEEINEKAIHAAQLVALLRSTIKRDHYTKEITHRPFSEMATRLSKQFRKLLLGVGMFRRLRKLDADAYEVIKKIVIGTIPSRFNDLIRKMYKKNKAGSYSLADAIALLRLPSVTTQRVLDGLTALEALDRTGFAHGVVPSWKLSAEIIELIERSEVYK